MKGKHFWLLTVLSTLLWAAPEALAQWRGGPPGGGFSSGDMFDRLDEDGSGVIEPQEIENSRMRFMVEGMGIDISENITREDYSEASDRMRKRFQEGGGFGGFGRGGWGGRDRDDDGDDNRSSRRSRWGGRDDDDESRSRFGRDRGDSRTAEAELPTRVTVDLPADYAPGDADRDGQIGLYEWTQWKSRAAMGQFLGLDRDGDGFLTPRELTRASDAKPVDVATFFQPSPNFQPTRTGTASRTTSVPPVTSPDSSSTPPAENTVSTRPTLSSADPQAVIAAADQGQVKQAQRLFSLLDKDRDGSVSEAEWSGSRKLKPKFEQAGVDLAQPMSSDQFVSYYVRISAADESI